jgi:hypothetical protein
MPTTVESLPFDIEWALAVVAVCAAGLYVSSLNSSGMRAFLASFPTLALAALVSTVVLGPVSFGAGTALRPLARDLSPFHDLDWRFAETLMAWGVALPIALGFGLVLLRFAGTNHRSADRSAGRIRHQALWMLVYAIGAVIVGAFANELVQAGLRQFPR